MNRQSVLRFLLVAALVAVPAALAGCISSGSPTAVASTSGPAAIPSDWAERAIPFGNGHDHNKLDHHRGLSTPNFQVLGSTPLVSEYFGYTAGGHWCGDVATTAEGRRLAVVHSFDTDVAFAVADVTDPANPVTLGEYILQNVHTYDVAVTPDGKHVVLGAYPGGVFGGKRDTAGLPLDVAGRVLVQPQWRDACTGEVRNAGPEQALPIYPGAILVGLGDPTEPNFEDFYPTPVLGPHSVSTAEVNGEMWAIASITNLAHPGSYFVFFQVLETPLGGKLLHLSTVDSQMIPGSLVVSNGHVDASVQVHPITGQPIAYLANWGGGMVTLDMSIPQAPKVLAQWTDRRGTGTGAVHSTLPIEDLWEGKHYTIVGQEFGGRPGGRPTGWIYVLDTTNPAQPTEVGRWTLPVDVSWERSFQFSTHYFTLVGRTLFVSLYHGGVWAVDLSTPSALETPLTIGAFVPDRASPAPPRRGPSMGTPTVLDVLSFPNGDIAVYESGSGVYMLRFDAANPAPAPTPWPVPGRA